MSPLAARAEARASRAAASVRSRAASGAWASRRRAKYAKWVGVLAWSTFRYERTAARRASRLLRPRLPVLDLGHVRLLEPLGRQRLQRGQRLGMAPRLDHRRRVGERRLHHGVGPGERPAHRGEVGARLGVAPRADTDAEPLGQRGRRAGRLAAGLDGVGEVPLRARIVAGELGAARGVVEEVAALLRRRRERGAFQVALLRRLVLLGPEVGAADRVQEVLALARAGLQRPLQQDHRAIVVAVAARALPEQHPVGGLQGVQDLRPVQRAGHPLGGVVALVRLQEPHAGRHRDRPARCRG